MEVTVSSRHRAASDELRSYIESKIGRLDRFDGALDRAEVCFSEERNPRISTKERCEVTLRGGGHVIRAHSAAVEQFAAVDLVLEKLEHQLHKLKTRINDRRRGKGHLSPTVVHTVGEATVDPVADGVAGALAPVGPPPKVVRTKTFAMPAMSIEEAVTELEMVSHDFYVFTHAESGQLAVLYRRSDGDLGLIQPG
jgi:putative sigma-54 modulation protein